jgi:hypothetical protein
MHTVPILGHSPGNSYGFCSSFFHRLLQLLHSYPQPFTAPSTQIPSKLQNTSLASSVLTPGSNRYLLPWSRHSGLRWLPLQCVRAMPSEPMLCMGVGSIGTPKGTSLTTSSIPCPQQIRGSQQYHPHPHLLAPLPLASMGNRLLTSPTLHTCALRACHTAVPPHHRLFPHHLFPH